MEEKRHRLLGFFQRVYITASSFLSNNLLTHAAAGAYSFLLSALPIILLAVIILVRIFHTSIEDIKMLVETDNLISNSFNFSAILDSVTSIRSLGIFEIIIGFFIFRMARRFFASLTQSMQTIYRKRGHGKAIKENLIIIAGEIILIFFIVIMFIMLIAGNAFLNSALLQNFLSPFMVTLLTNLFRFVPITLVFLFLFLAYHFTPRTRPPAAYSLVASACCTITFVIVLIIFNSFVNLSRYNLVYGILSNVIVILFEVYIFFVLFLFFAQFQYVVQFYESFLLAQIYLLPDYSDPNPRRQFERIMFIKPNLLYRRYAVRKNKGDIIFHAGESTTEIYYIIQGTVRLNMTNQIIELGTGKTFGEFASLIGGNRTGNAIAETDCVLLRIPGELFLETIEVDGAMSRRTLQMVSDFVRKGNVTANGGIELLADENAEMPDK
ncbi:YihY/virulence factor BrkB family protein [Brucepastera parasyntrophica]|uniref:YhjD/YihY/BrkB family envelope integrity protein n=1 Tax=Brucepastera parasyntrophica TaxID=2880008 RepID=UPI00210876D2|nr:YhjD/YihY/BrkB family envelope integrity protein [Brucepastera parasyntrophica]ULQ60532.1 YihY/virulence factor BrkB family protein [Brucepastera parasyntrophica]